MRGRRSTNPACQFCADASVHKPKEIPAPRFGASFRSARVNAPQHDLDISASAYYLKQTSAAAAAFEIRWSGNRGSELSCEQA